MIGIGRPWAPDMSRKRTNNAYPRVISNLGQLSMDNDTKVALKMIRYMNHFARTLAEKQHIVKWFKHREGHYVSQQRDGNDFGGPVAFEEREKSDTWKWLPILTDQIPVGYANTLGWAHPNSGDTMVTVMIGGLRTVMNGDFEVFPGDILQWYWPFEKDCFHANGARKKYPRVWYPATVEQQGAELPQMLPPNVAPDYDPEIERVRPMVPDPGSSQRESFYSRGFGNVSEKQAKLVARVKPYVRDDDDPRIFDAYRVFGVAIAAARPHEMLDIKISRQSV